MAKNKNIPSFFSLKDQKAAADKRTKLYHIVNGIKGRPKENKKPPTEAQAKQQLRFGMATSFARQLKPMIDIGLKSKTKKMTAMNFSTKQILRDALVGDFPNFSIDCSKVMISDGSFDELWKCRVATTLEGSFILSWEPDAYPGREVSRNDLLFLTVYNLTKNVCYNYPAIGKRGDLILNMPIPDYSNEHFYHCWIFMASPNLRQISTCSYFTLTTFQSKSYGH